MNFFSYQFLFIAKSSRGVSDPISFAFFPFILFFYLFHVMNLISDNAFHPALIDVINFEFSALWSKRIHHFV